MVSTLHTWGSINSHGGRIGNCGCSDDGEQAKHAKEHVDGGGEWKGRTPHDINDGERED